MQTRSWTSLVLGCAFAAIASAQITARLSGSIVDPSGAVVPGATVDVLLPGGAKPILSQTTTAEGLFAFTAVPAGTYDLSITAAGFRKYAERKIVLSAGAETAPPPNSTDLCGPSRTRGGRQAQLSVQSF